jgi:hypothetical protein
VRLLDERPKLGGGLLLQSGLETLRGPLPPFAAEKGIARCRVLGPGGRGE